MPSNNFDNSNIYKYFSRIRHVKLLWLILGALILVIIAVGVLASLQYPDIVASEAESESESASIEESVDASIAESEAASIAESLAALETEPETTRDPFEGYVSPIDFESLWAQNPDVIAWLSIPSLEIEYPVLQNPEEDGYYLRRDIDGNYKTAGCLFTEHSYNRTDFTDPVTIIYGHNMHDGSMFGTLQEAFGETISGDGKGNNT